MSSPHEKLATSLKILKKSQDEGRNVFKSNYFTRTHRERLLKNGFLREVMKGWLISSHPEDKLGESTSWYAHFWDFCIVYCNEKFGANWHLSPEHSLLLHVSSTTIPKQTVVYSPEASNNLVKLLFDTSIYDLKQGGMSEDDSEIVEINGVNVYSLETSLTKIPPSFYENYPKEVQIALSQINDVSKLLRVLLVGGHSSVASRLVGAFNSIGKKSHADSIQNAFIAAGYKIYNDNPFAPGVIHVISKKNVSALAARIELLWLANRETVLERYLAKPKFLNNPADYLKNVDELYTKDAYHSLSIEGYNVTLDLIKKVSLGKWNPEGDPDDSSSKDALAARGYYQAFQLVKADLEKILLGDDAVVDIIQNNHGKWYLELFQPSVQAGIIPAYRLAGYRNNPVYLRGSRHVPPRCEAIPEAMDMFFSMLRNEENKAVKAVLAHWLFGYIHPYPDGNGRIARFIMNLLFADGGYPWKIIEVESRREYLRSLEQASVEGNLIDFTEFLR